MNKTIILPMILIIIDISQSIVCVAVNNYPKSLYWFAAALITFSTVLMK